MWNKLRSSFFFRSCEKSVLHKHKFKETNKKREYKVLNIGEGCNLILIARGVQNSKKYELIDCLCVKFHVNGRRLMRQMFSSHCFVRIECVWSRVFKNAHYTGNNNNNKNTRNKSYHAKYNISNGYFYRLNAKAFDCKVFYQAIRFESSFAFNYVD